jgi:hypothetical protein
MMPTGDGTTDPRELVDKIFSIERNIRYVGIIGPGPKYELLESRMRDDAKSLAPMKTTNEFVEIVPQVILGASEKLENHLGDITYSLIRYRNATLVFFKTAGYTVTLSIEPAIVVKPLYERMKRLVLSQDLLGEAA